MAKREMLEKVKTWNLNAVEELDLDLYDRYKLLSTTTKISLFNTPVSAQRQGAALTLADTNVAGTTVPSNEDWVVHGVGFRYLSLDAKTDAEIQQILDMMRNLVVSIKVGGKDVMWQVSGDAFLGGVQLISAPAVQVNSRFPQPKFSSYIPLEVSIPLEHLTGWSMEVEHIVAPAAALDNDLMRFYLKRQVFRNS